MNQSISSPILTKVSSNFEISCNQLSWTFVTSTHNGHSHKYTRLRIKLYKTSKGWPLIVLENHTQRDQVIRVLFSLLHSSTAYIVSTYVYVHKRCLHTHRLFIVEAWQRTVVLRCIPSTKNRCLQSADQYWVKVGLCLNMQVLVGMIRLRVRDRRLDPDFQSTSYFVNEYENYSCIFEFFIIFDAGILLWTWSYLCHEHGVMEHRLPKWHT